MYILVLLKFTPLEFETTIGASGRGVFTGLKFTPLEFETYDPAAYARFHLGLKFTPLEFETGPSVRVTCTNT